MAQDSKKHRLNEELKRILDEHRISNPKAAEELGCDAATVWRYVHGKLPVSESVLLQVKRLTRDSRDVEGYPWLNERLQELRDELRAPTEEERDLLERIAKLDYEKRVRVMRMFFEFLKIIEAEPTPQIKYPVPNKVRHS